MWNVQIYKTICEALSYNKCCFCNYFWCREETLLSSKSEYQPTTNSLLLVVDWVCVISFMTFDAAASAHIYTSGRCCRGHLQYVLILVLYLYNGLGSWCRSSTVHFGQVTNPLQGQTNTYNTHSRMSKDSLIFVCSEVNIFESWEGMVRHLFSNFFWNSIHLVFFYYLFF